MNQNNKNIMDKNELNQENNNLEIDYFFSPEHNNNPRFSLSHFDPNQCSNYHIQTLRAFARHNGLIIPRRGLTRTLLCELLETEWQSRKDKYLLLTGLFQQLKVYRNRGLDLQKQYQTIARKLKQQQQRQKQKQQKKREQKHQRQQTPIQNPTINNSKQVPLSRPSSLSSNNLNNGIKQEEKETELLPKLESDSNNTDYNNNINVKQEPFSEEKQIENGNGNQNFIKDINEPSVQRLEEQLKQTAQNEELNRQKIIALENTIESLENRNNSQLEQLNSLRQRAVERENQVQKQIEQQKQIMQRQQTRDERLIEQYSKWWKEETEQGNKLNLKVKKRQEEIRNLKNAVQQLETRLKEEQNMRELLDSAAKETLDQYKLNWENEQSENERLHTELNEANRIINNNIVNNTKRIPNLPRSSFFPRPVNDVVDDVKEEEEEEDNGEEPLHIQIKRFLDQIENENQNDNDTSSKKGGYENDNNNNNQNYKTYKHRISKPILNFVLFLVYKKPWVSQFELELCIKQLYLHYDRNYDLDIKILNDLIYSLKK